MHRLQQRRQRPGHRSAGHADPRHQERHPGSDAIKVKGVITWVGVNDAVQAEVRLYDRLFKEAHPGTGEKDFMEELNPDSLKVVAAYVEPSLANVPAGQRFQFERHGYFVTDIVDHKPGKTVFNRVTGMKDSWGK